ncbi:hypothetical protein COY05_03530 [Candidatus Peregrinibacteria bacterium CG_4_10_14_0_2_um_filter_38_24]|nr:MAG: hypothetical protein COY05_03530 [Candidatus Peregrinibacteria bacterium CG_4_10_14_0_2_um_filter_38_24]PJC38664.1 MAG: hypothetical protein CO044_03840 [Candidatus Peregrinibacteria bacterium CG_4_9_14_0_2_um_filter_38_9]
MNNVIGQPKGVIGEQTSEVTKTPFERLLEARGISAEDAQAVAVDDEEALARMGKRILSRGLRVEAQTAHSGAEGLAVMEGLHGKIACVVTDVNMGRMSGPEMVKQANARRLLDNVPVVVVTGELVRNAEEIDTVTAGGIAHEVLEKPFNPDQFVAAIQSACQKVLDKMEAETK